MKFNALMVMFLFALSSQASSFSFNDTVELKKIYLSKKILPSDLMNLYEPFSNKRVRMIAGKKSTWADGLRQRLKGMKGTPSIKF